MNPDLLQRIRKGAFVAVTIENETPFSGYIGVDPSVPADSLRMDGCVLDESGHLERISIRLAESDITSVHFLNEPPTWIDLEGHSVTMDEGFFPDPPAGG